jgi:TP901 family phage tail tape measure protein
MPIASPEIRFLADVKHFERAMKTLETKVTRHVNRLARKADKLGRDFERAGKRLSTAITAPLVAIGIAAGRTTVAFDDSLTKINTLVGVSERQVAAWRAEILKLGPAVGRGPAELADAMFFVTSAGARGKTAMEILTASAKAAAVGMGDTSIVADAATSAMNAYGQENLAAADAVGILVATVKEGKAEASAIANAIGQVIPVAAELDVTFDQVGATIAALTRQGTDASTAATQLTAILSKILKPAEQAKKELAGVGMSVEGLRKSIQSEGLLTTLTNLKKAFQGNQEGLARVFEDASAVRAVFALVGKNAAANEQIFKSLSKSGMADLEKAFEGVSKSAGFKFRQAMAMSNAALIELGSVIVPAILPLLQQLVVVAKRITSAFAGLSPKTKDMILKFAAIAAAIGPVLLIAGALTTSFASLLRATTTFAMVGWKSIKIFGVGAAKSLMKVVSAVRLLILTVGGLPLLIGTVLAGVIAGILVFKNTLIEIFSTLWTVIGGKFVQGFINYVERPFKKALNALFDKLPEWLKEKLSLGELFEIPEEVKFDASDAFGEGWERAKAQAKADAAAFTGFFTEAGTKIKDKIKSLMPAGVSGLLFGGDGEDGFSEGEDYFAKLKAALEDVGSTGADTALTLSEKFEQVGQSLEKNVSARIETALMNFQDLGTMAKSVLQMIVKEIFRVIIVQEIAGQIGGLIGNLFGGGGAGKGGSVPLEAGGALGQGIYKGYAKGLSGVVGGKPGRDRNFFGAWLTKGENVNITPAGGGGGGGAGMAPITVEIHNHYDVGLESVDQRIAASAPRTVQAAKVGILEAISRGGSARQAVRV